MDILGLALIGILENPFFFVLGACIVAVTACIVARFCSFTINIGWVILGVLGLAALALLAFALAFAPAFSLSVALLVFAYRIGMTKLVPRLREVHQPRQASPVDDEWVSPVVDEWVRPVPQPQPQPRQAPSDRELVVYKGVAQAPSPKAGQIDPWMIWAVVGSMTVMFVGLVIASQSPPAGAAPAWRSAPMHVHHHRHRQ